MPAEYRFELVKRKRWFERLVASETLLIIAGLAIAFLFLPLERFDNPFYVQMLIIMPVRAWGIVEAIISGIGIYALCKVDAKIWQIFCMLSSCLLSTLAVSLFLSGSVLGALTYGVLSYTAFLRLIKISSYMVKEGGKNE